MLEYEDTLEKFEKGVKINPRSDVVISDHRCECFRLIQKVKSHENFWGSSI